MSYRKLMGVLLLTLFLSAGFMVVHLPTSGAETFTGLIVDARKAGMLPAMSPKVTSERGEVVYGEMKVDLDYVILVGIAGYASTLDEALTYIDRIGENPLVVEALDVRGPLKAEVVISDGDTQDIQAAVRGNDFLKDYKVIFVVL